MLPFAPAIANSYHFALQPAVGSVLRRPSYWTSSARQMAQPTRSAPKLAGTKTGRTLTHRTLDIAHDQAVLVVQELHTHLSDLPQKLASGRHAERKWLLKALLTGH